MSNFSNIPLQWAALAEAPTEAEQNIYHAAFLCGHVMSEKSGGVDKVDVST
jgi:hypothetical protein